MLRPFFYLFCGCILAFVSLLWFVHMLVYMLVSPPASLFLNAYFLWFNTWFPILGHTFTPPYPLSFSTTQPFSHPLSHTITHILSYAISPTRIPLIQHVISPPLFLSYLILSYLRRGQLRSLFPLPPVSHPFSHPLSHLLSYHLFFSFLGEVSYGLFSLYLLFCTMKGCFKFGLSVFCIRIYPVKGVYPHTQPRSLTLSHPLTHLLSPPSLASIRSKVFIHTHNLALSPFRTLSHTFSHPPRSHLSGQRCLSTHTHTLALSPFCTLSHPPSLIPTLSHTPSHPLPHPLSHRPSLIPPLSLSLPSISQWAKPTWTPFCSTDHTPSLSSSLCLPLTPSLLSPPLSLYPPSPSGRNLHGRIFVQPSPGPRVHHTRHPLLHIGFRR